MTTVAYYLSPTGKNPVKEFIDSLNIKQIRKITHLFKAIQTYGLSAIHPHLKKVTQTPFYELRILGSDNIRLFFINTSSDSVILLHGYIKKTQKIPLKELQTLNKAYSNYQISLDK